MDTRIVTEEFKKWKLSNTPKCNSYSDREGLRRLMTIVESSVTQKGSSNGHRKPRR